MDDRWIFSNVCVFLEREEKEFPLNSGNGSSLNHFFDILGRRCFILQITNTKIKQVRYQRAEGLQMERRPRGPGAGRGLGLKARRMQHQGKQKAARSFGHCIAGWGPENCHEVD